MVEQPTFIACVTHHEIIFRWNTWDIKKETKKLRIFVGKYSLQNFLDAVMEEIKEI